MSQLLSIIQCILIHWFDAFPSRIMLFLLSKQLFFIDEITIWLKNNYNSQDLLCIFAGYNYGSIHAFAQNSKNIQNNNKFNELYNIHAICVMWTIRSFVIVIVFLLHWWCQTASIMLVNCIWKRDTVTLENIHKKNIQFSFMKKKTKLR